MDKRPRNLVANTLAFAERLLKTDIRYLITAGSWSTAAQVAAVFSSLALSLIVSRYVSKDVYGEYKYILSILSIVSLFSLNDLGSAVMQSAARGLDGALPLGFKANLRWSIFALIGSIAVATYYLFGQNVDIAVGILIGGCLSPLIASANLSIAFLNGKKDFARSAIYTSILGNTIPAAALIVTALIAPTPLALISVYFLSNAVTDLYFYWRTVKLYTPDPTKQDPGMLSYGKHLSAMGILAGISQNIDQVLVFHFLGPVQLAIYSFATGIVDQSRGPLKSLDSMIRAQFALRSDADVDSGMNNKMLWLFVFSAVCTTVYFFIAPYIYEILFPAYTAAVEYSRVYALTLFGMITTPALSYMFAKKHTRALYIDNGVSAVFQILLMVVGVIGWGLWGLIVARVIARLLGSVLTQSLYRSSLRT